MPIDFNDIRSQLRPGFTPVNSALLVLLFFLSWPLAFAMLAYILAGDRIGLDLGRPETYGAAFGQLKQALSGALKGFQNPNGTTTGSGHTGTPAGDYQNLQREKDKLKAERSALERERQTLEEEKQAWQKEKSH